MANKIILIIALILSITVQTGCVKVELYDTDHPNHGKIISLTATWDDRSEGIDIPDSYTAKIGDHTATLHKMMNRMENLFPAGGYTIYAWNTADNITLSFQQSPAATADYAAGEIGWLFTGTENVTIEKDKDHAFTVAMHQMVRQLTLELEIEGNAVDRITGVGATLSGVAGTINIENGNPTGEAVTVMPAFTLTGGMQTATLRLLGITGTVQTLVLTLHLTGITHTVTSDLTEKLAGFNAERKTPLSLRSKLTVNIDETSDELVLSASLDDWQSDGSTEGTAD